MLVVLSTLPELALLTALIAVVLTKAVKHVFANVQGEQFIQRHGQRGHRIDKGLQLERACTQTGLRQRLYRLSEAFLLLILIFRRARGINGKEGVGDRVFKPVLA